MADELSMSCSVQFAKGEQSFDTDRDMDLLGQLLTVAGTNYIRATQTATTSAAALGKGAISTVGLLVVRNRGAVDVKIRSGSGGADVVLVPAGKGFAFYSATSTPFIVTASSTAVLEYIMVEA